MALEVSICASCGGAFAAPLDLCYACFHAVKKTAPDTGARRRSLADADIAYPLLSARDFALLERLARLRLRADDPVSRALLAKLDQARVTVPDAAAPNAASLNSRVVFSAGAAPAEARVLVLPEDHSPAGWTLPVTTSRGLALLGLVAGAAVTATRGDGLHERLRLLAVSPQPEMLATNTAARAGGNTGSPAPAGAALPPRGAATSRRPARSGGRVQPRPPAP